MALPAKAYKGKTNKLKEVPNINLASNQEPKPNDGQNPARDFLGATEPDQVLELMTDQPIPDKNGPPPQTSHEKLVHIIADDVDESEIHDELCLLEVKKRRLEVEERQLELKQKLKKRKHT